MPRHVADIDILRYVEFSDILKLTTVGLCCADAGIATTSSKAVIANVFIVFFLQIRAGSHAQRHPWGWRDACDLKLPRAGDRDWSVPFANIVES